MAWEAGKYSDRATFSSGTESVTTDRSCVRPHLRSYEVARVISIPSASRTVHAATAMRRSRRRPRHADRRGPAPRCPPVFEGRRTSWWDMDLRSDRQRSRPARHLAVTNFACLRERRQLTRRPQPGASRLRLIEHRTARATRGSVRLRGAGGRPPTAAPQGCP